MSGANERRASGFTLLEVLAAAMIFAVVVTVLVGSSSETVHRARISANRLEASQIADREIATLESLLSNRLPPPEDREETLDDFIVTVSSEPALETDLPAPNASNDSLSLFSDTANGIGALGALLSVHAPGLEAFLLRYEIAVAWEEGSVSQQLRRTTFAFDWEGARRELPDLFTSGDGGENAEGDSSSSSEDLPESAARLLEQLSEGQ
jgi:prepilin-type N-terminal cleavage/methylation domain-containing protein